MEIINIDSAKDKKEFKVSKNKYSKDFLTKAINEKITIKEFNNIFEKLISNCTSHEN